jgi:hypothetical protein
MISPSLFPKMSTSKVQLVARRKRRKKGSSLLQFQLV